IGCRIGELCKETRKSLLCRAKRLNHQHKAPYGTAKAQISRFFRRLLDDENDGEKHPEVIAHFKRSRFMQIIPKSAPAFLSSAIPSLKFLCEFCGARWTALFRLISRN